jgi:hypothetical protein
MKSESGRAAPYRRPLPCQAGYSLLIEKMIPPVNPQKPENVIAAGG